MPYQTFLKLPRKERERKQHRLEVLETAEKLFVSKGFHGTSIQEIAGAAEFSVGKIYTLFESKEDIYATLTDMRAEEVYQLTKAAHSREGTAWEKIRRNLTGLLEFLDSHKEILHIFIYQTAGFPLKISAGVSGGVYEYYIKTLECIQQTFREGVISGEFINSDAEDLVLAWAGIVQMFCMYETFARPEASLQPLVERIMKVFANQLVRDIDYRHGNELLNRAERVEFMETDRE